MANSGSETYQALKDFMALAHDERDEFLFLQNGRLKSVLESEGIVQAWRDMNRLVNGHEDQAGIMVRIKWLEAQVETIARTNRMLQRAIYVATGAYLAVKIILELFPNIHP